MVRLILLLSFLFFISCDTENTADSTAPVLPPPPAASGVSPITFKMVNEQVIATNCSQCHSVAGGNKGGINLEGYTNTFNRVDALRETVVTRANHMAPMPALSEAQTKLLLAWIDSGAPETEFEVPSMNPGGNPERDPEAGAPQP